MFGRQPLKNLKRHGLHKHGTIIRTGITCKKISGYMRHSAYRWLIVENFRSYLEVI